jgi:single-strand selective monofunctional uracil DNA glycosylase
MPTFKTSEALITAAGDLRDAVNRLSFAAPISHVYNPLDYAWGPHTTYLKRFGAGRKRVILLGMNPGPFGMAQIGIPFGEIAAARDWMGINEPVGKPKSESPKRLVEGFACPRSEVSGRRLWGLFAQRFGTADKFFADHFVANYCPLAFLEDGSRNITPDKLPPAETAALYAACDAHLARMVEVLRPDWLIGIGGFAEERALVAAEKFPVKVGRILHPSPASPAANKDWAGNATRSLLKLGIWQQGNDQ